MLLRRFEYVPIPIQGLKQIVKRRDRHPKYSPLICNRIAYAVDETIHKECSSVNGVTNGWDMKLPGGQHPRRAFEPNRTLLSVLYLSPHKVRLNPAELNTTKILKYFNRSIYVIVKL